MNEKYQFLTHAPVHRVIGAMAIPTIISMLLTSVYNLVDTFFVGQIDTQSTAAVGIVFSVMFFIQAFSFFFGNGSGNYISRQLGAQKTEDAETMASTGLFYTLAFSILTMLLGLLFLEPISISALRYQMIVFPACSFMLMANMMMQTCRKTIRANILAASRQGLFFIPLIIILPHCFGLLGVEICQAVSDLISLIVTIPIVWTTFREMIDFNK